jgi:hypothetical protein
MKNGFLAVLVVFIIGILSYQSISLSELKEQSIADKKKIDSLQYQLDSLNYEIFPLEVELGRYEVAYQIFLERNPKAAEQYGNIISDETE